MSLSFSSLQNEIGYLFYKLAEDNNILLNNRKINLAEIKQLFNQLNISNFDELIKLKIEDYRKNIEQNSLAQVIDFDEVALFNSLQEYSNFIKQSQEKLFELSNKDNIIVNDREYLLKLKEIRDLISSDIKVSGRKKIESYFENYSKFLTTDQIKILSNIIIKIQNEIINIWNNYINFGRDDIYKQIISNPNFEISSRVNSEKQQLRALDLENEKLLSSHLHTENTKGGVTLESKNIPYYLESPSLGSKELEALKKKMQEINLIFSIIDIGFNSPEHLIKKCSKLEAYSQLTGDNKLFQNFLICLRNIIKTNFNINDQEKYKKNIENIQSINSFFELKKEKEKLKIIFRLKLNTETINLLKNYKIIQRGTECKFVKSPNKESIILSPEALSVISSEMTKISFNKYYQKYFSMIKNSRYYW